MKEHPELPVLGREELDGLIDRESKARQLRGEPDVLAHEIKFACTDHLDRGLDVFYEGGLLVLLCNVCGQLKGQIEVAQQARVLVDMGSPEGLN